jgi:hypothetical protein
VFIFGVILQITGYQPPAKPEQSQPLAKAPEERQAKAVEPRLSAAQASADNEPEPNPPLLEPIDPAWTDIDPSVIKYDIAALEPGHIGVIKRYAFRVVVHQRLSKAQLALIADTI